MKIVIAPDSFKECLSAAGVASAIEAGIRQVIPDADIVKVPVADGGEGTLQSLIDGTDGQLIYRTVTGPHGRPVEAGFGLLGDGETAVIEMAQASGLELLKPEQRNPMTATSYGTGELIRAALDLDVRHVIVAIGGSATNDGGAGMMEALGCRFLDSHGQPLARGGAALARLAHINTSCLDQRLKNVRFTAACDVDNPLTGPKGASAVFGPQKGASPEMVGQLDMALANYARIIEKDMNLSVEHTPGSGAAGGMGAGLLSFLQAELRPGIDIVLEAVALDEHLKGANLVITGEGRMDSQTIHGKTPVGVARRAKLQDIPVIALAGSVGDGSELVHDHGIDAVFPVVHGAVPLQQALEAGAINLQRTARNIAKVIQLSH